MQIEKLSRDSFGSDVGRHADRIPVYCAARRAGVIMQLQPKPGYERRWM